MIYQESFPAGHLGPLYLHNLFESIHGSSILYFFAFLSQLWFSIVAFPFQAMNEKQIALQFLIPDHNACGISVLKVSVQAFQNWSAFGVPLHCVPPDLCRLLRIIRNAIYSNSFTFSFAKRSTGHFSGGSNQLPLDCPEEPLVASRSRWSLKCKKRGSCVHLALCLFLL